MSDSTVDQRCLDYLDALTNIEIHPQKPSEVEDHSRAYLALPPLEHHRRGIDEPSIDTEHIYATLDHIDSRSDCADFGLHALLRIRYRYQDNIDPEVRSAIDETLRGAVYWFEDENTEMWFSTENHQVLYGAAELLAGALLANRTFTVTGEIGAWHRDRAAERLTRWLDWRARFGFSEWLSNQYYDEDIVALLNVAEYAPSADLRRRAGFLVNLLCYELAVNSFDGHLMTTHGRAYADTVLNPDLEPVAPVCYLGWGNGEPPNTLGLGAVALAAGSHRIPAAIRAIGRDQPAELLHIERHGLDVEEAPEFGINPNDPADTLFFWGELVMGHRDVAETALEVCSPNYRLRYAEIEPAVRYHRNQGKRSDYTPDPNNTALTRVDTMTFRTPDYVLSCAQDYRPGAFGFQQHIWQASLGERALVFTNHPQGGPDTSMDNYWTCNGVLPRTAAHKGICVALYHIGQPPYLTPDIPGFDESLAAFPYTHAYVPRFAFDDWVEQGDWVCGRRNNGYVAIGTPQETRWCDPETDICELLDLDDPLPYDLVVDNQSVAWVCEVGRRETHGTFDEFVENMTTGTITGDTSSLSYDSPSVGQVTFGWDEPFIVDGQKIPLTSEARYRDPYCHVPFGETTVTLDVDSVQCQLSLEW